MSMSTTVISQLFSLFLFSIWTSFPVHLFIIDAVHGISPSTNSPPHSDAVSLLSFKSKADLGNQLVYDLKSRFDYCQWSGVKCLQGRVIRFVLQDYGLRGAFAANTLSSLDQLRVLSLHNNSLVGPIPDLSGLVNLRSLFLSRNSFTGAFPPSITTLHRLQILDISYNNFSGSLPATLFSLERLISLRLEWNFFNGSIPSLNQSFLESFNVSGNNLSGQIPVTPTLSRFGASAFSGNPALCGEIINKECYAHSPFFKAPNSTPPSEPPIQIAGSESEIQSSTHEKRGRNTVFIVGLSIGVVTVIVAVLLCLLVALRGCKTQNTSKPVTASFPEATTAPDVEIQVVDVGLQSKGTKEERVPRAQKNGTLIFCGGEEHLYTLEQLMRASAEFLGRGSIGTTYKAAIVNQLIVTVKRLDAAKTATPSGEMFEKHMSTVGGLCHPNLVPVRAYFQAKGERLVIYDYQPNGSLFSLIHGSRSTRSKPLHWTSCLKIADDVAQGIAYIHQATSLVHGNLKSSNVLLGADFEARLTDYSLNTLVESSHSQEDVNSMPPKAILSHNNSMQKGDVYAYGVLLLELLTGKQPSQHPYLELGEVPDWVRTMREEEDGGESHKLSMLVEVATIASFTSPEQRPEMWQVLQMIQEIKESLMRED